MSVTCFLCLQLQQNQRNAVNESDELELQQRIERRMTAIGMIFSLTLCVLQ